MSQAINGLDTTHFIRMDRKGLAMLAVVHLAYLSLYLLAVLLIALTDHDPVGAKIKWELFIPLIGLVSALGGWSQHAGTTTKSRVYFVIRLILHWSALVLVVNLLFMQDVQQFLDAEKDGFVIIYLVGLTSILAGIHLDFKMAVFGFFLIFSGIVIAFLDDNALLISLSIAAAMIVAVTTFLLIKYWRRGKGVTEPGKA